MIEFTPWPKIGRFNQPCVITEKLDGTNAAVRIVPIEEPCNASDVVVQLTDYQLLAQSRSRFITPHDDNFGFAAWVRDNASELIKLGPGLHFGEWWGAGIQRGYNLTERRFSLFNTNRWETQKLPACVGLVPVLYKGPFSPDAHDAALAQLAKHGSAAAPGFMKPEGIITYFSSSRTLFKTTFEHNKGKWHEASFGS